MLTPYVVAMAVMAVLTSLWLGVQLARRRAFPETALEGDLGGERVGCGACPRNEECEPAREL